MFYCATFTEGNRTRLFIVFIVPKPVGEKQGGFFIVKRGKMLFACLIEYDQGRVLTIRPAHATGALSVN